jgi:hypothetical protein
MLKRGTSAPLAAIQYWQQLNFKIMLHQNESLLAGTKVKIK